MPDHNPEAARREAEKAILEGLALADPDGHLANDGFPFGHIIESVAKALAQSRREAEAATWESAIVVAKMKNHHKGCVNCKCGVADGIVEALRVGRSYALGLAADGHGLRGGEGSV